MTPYKVMVPWGEGDKKTDGSIRVTLQPMERKQKKRPFTLPVEDFIFKTYLSFEFSLLRKPLLKEEVS